MLKNYYSTGEMAKMLGISRIAIFKKIKLGQIEAEKIGRNYFIPATKLPFLVSTALNPATKATIDAAVRKTVKQYGQTLKLLGLE